MCVVCVCVFGVGGGWALTLSYLVMKGEQLQCVCMLSRELPMLE